MATLTWLGNAAAVKQIDTVTVANTWTAADTATLTINTKDLVVTIGADVTPAQVATAIRDAWNATSRLDSEGATDATSNFGGQEFGEYSEVEASIDPDADTVVIFTAIQAGVPFTLAVTETTAGTGTATEATTQAATGKHHWNNGDNWSSGSAPASDDIVVFRDSDVSCLYGLPNATLEVTFNVYQSYTGSIGLPAINRSNQSKQYAEYRQRYVRLDDAGGGSNIAHRFGIGKDGTGSPLINLKHITLPCTVVVYNTGTPQIAGTKALNICCGNNTSTISILAGSVDFSTQDGTSAAFALATQTGGDSRCIEGMNAASDVRVRGGAMLLGDTSGLSAIFVGPGVLRIEGQVGTIDDVVVENGGTVDYASTATITSLTVTEGGVFDARSGVGAFTLTSTSVYKGGKLIDPYVRATFTSPADIYFDVGDSLQLGGAPTQAIKVDR